MSMVPRFLILLAAMSLPVGAAGQAFGAFPEADLEFFEKKIRPLLTETCFECHSILKQESNLRLDSRAAILVGGDRGPAAQSGKPALSRMIEAVRHEIEELEMPATGSLSAEQIADLERWITLGLPWPEEPEAEQGTAPKGFDLEARRESHWAWQPLKARRPPAVADRSWPSNPMDRFILSRLEAKGLHPAPRADRRTLLRRVYFDLIGLPPSIDQIEAFLEDDSPEAYEKVVDALLASPRFGERWGRHWLDLMRYAESYGHEQDYPIRYAWRYRDYVIRALNADLPYDRFLTEHIAGDLLENPRRHPSEGYNESIIATGFWFLSQGTHGPVDVRKDEADRIDNQIDVLSKAFLGLTVACARCHDHKFDAISTRDYYSLAGFLQSSRRQHALLDPGGRIRDAAEELESVHEKTSALFAESLKRTSRRSAETIAAHLEAAHEVMRGRWRPEDGPASLKPRIVFDDFESGDYGNWEIFGEAFERPKRGRSFSGLAARSGAENDRLTTGRLLSRPFLIERRFIRFRIAGGRDPDRTAVRLLIDEEPVRTSAGKNRDASEWVHWETEEFLGRRARIEVIDDASEKWGWIAVDDFTFAEDLFIEPIRRPIKAVAGQFDLEEERLEAWVRSLQSVDAGDRAHPLHAWLVTGSGVRRGEEGGWRRAREKLDALHTEQMEREARAAETSILFEDFNGPDFGSWYVTGEAFGRSPTRAGQLGPIEKGAQLPPAGVAHSGLLSKKLTGVLRSPTFEITKKNIHFRVAGRGTDVRLIIDGYTIHEFNALLFEDCLKKIDTDGQFEWISMTRRIDKYIGHRAHIEIVDDGKGWVAVDEIRFSDAGAESLTANAVTEALLESEGEQAADPIAKLAGAYGAVAAEAMEEWGTASEPSAGGALVTWLRREGLIDFGMGEALISWLADYTEETEAELPDPMRALAIADGNGEDERVFIRGNAHVLGEIAPRRFLRALGGEEQTPIAAGSGRMELARRMLADSNPLPARVMANRVWHHLFGRGIVATVDNFGALGEAPTHPELLDYLAWRFRSEGWSVKSLIRLIATSSAYRMTSRALDPDAERIDPANLLVHRMRVKRLEGEAGRDAMLAVSGRLDEKMFGSPVPIRLTRFMDGRNRPKSGPVDGDGRRSIYLSVRRNFLSPTMLAFDTPIPESTIGRRNVSNVPAQALIMMNDPFVALQAEQWIGMLQESPGASIRGRIEAMYGQALGRPPTASELFHAAGFLRRQREALALEDPEADAEARAWADFAHVIFMLKEFIFIG